MRKINVHVCSDDPQLVFKHTALQHPHGLNYMWDASIVIPGSDIQTAVCDQYIQGRELFTLMQL